MQKSESEIKCTSSVTWSLNFDQRKLLLNAFIKSHFSHAPVVWIFHSRKLNNRINKIHERALRLVYKDYTSSFDDLLAKDNSFKIHQRNLQKLAIEIFKVKSKIKSWTPKNCPCKLCKNYIQHLGYL